MVEVDHVPAHRRTAQGACEQADDHGEPIALVARLHAAERQQHAFVGAPGVGQWLALAIDHPAFRHGLAAQRLGFHFAVSRNCRRHVEDNRLFIAGGNSCGNRVGRQQHVEAAPGRQMVGVADGKIEPDHVVLQRHRRVERRRSRMVTVLRVDPGDPGGACLFDRDLGRAFHHQVTHAVVAVQKRGGRVLVHDPDIGPYVESARLDAAGILRQPANAVAVRSLQIGLRHQGGDISGVGFRQTQPRHRLLDEGFQPVVCHCRCRQGTNSRLMDAALARTISWQSPNWIESLPMRRRWRWSR